MKNSPNSRDIFTLEENKGVLGAFCSKTPFPHLMLVKDHNDASRLLANYFPPNRTSMNIYSLQLFSTYEK
jgi:hypothetical protein